MLEKCRYLRRDEGAFFITKGNSMRKKNKLVKMSLAALFLALAYVMPILT